MSGMTANAAVADLQLAVSGLLSAAVQIAVGVVVLGVVVVLVYAAVRGSLR